MKKCYLTLILLLFLAPVAGVHEGASVEVLAKTRSSWDGTSLAPYQGAHHRHKTDSSRREGLEKYHERVMIVPVGE